MNVIAEGVSHIHQPALSAKLNTFHTLEHLTNPHSYLRSPTWRVPRLGLSLHTKIEHVIIVRSTVEYFSLKYQTL